MADERQINKADEVAISVQNVSKCFEINHAQTDNFKQDAIRFFKKIFTGTENNQDNFWALRDISFELKQGETLGIIGANGAGKSTLLKILSGISEPTSGRIEINGKLAAILDVGTGFHPDLTGKENIYLSGNLIGMSKEEINSRYAEIVEFSGIKNFIDTPVKYYSSGMYIRLAFSIIAFLEADIMIFDEVISVGDAEFTMQCKKKLEELTSKGKTLIIASHNMNELFNYCHHTIRLEKGKICSEGDTGNEISNYLEDVFRKQKAKEIDRALSSQTITTPNEQIWKNTSEAPGNDEIRLSRFSVFTERAKNETVFFSDEKILVEIEYHVLQKSASKTFNLVVRNMEGNPVFASEAEFANHSSADVGEYRASCAIPENLLNQGIFVLTFYYASGETFFKFPAESVFKIKVKELNDSKRFQMFFGPVRPKLTWHLEKINPT